MRCKSEETSEAIIRFINTFYDNNCRSPSLREIENITHISRQTAHRYIQTLADKGRLSYDGRIILTKHIQERIGAINVRVPILGKIACGSPANEEENEEGFVDIPRSLLGPGQFFFLRANGDSMRNAGIEKGDLVLVRSQITAKSGDIVVVLNNNNENTLKRLLFDGKRYYLHPENPQYSDYYPSEIQIQGIALKVLKDLLI